MNDSSSACFTGSLSRGLGKGCGAATGRLLANAVFGLLSCLQPHTPLGLAQCTDASRFRQEGKVRDSCPNCGIGPLSRDFVLPEDSVSSVVGRLATLPRTVLRRLTSAASRPALPASAHRTSNGPSRAAHSRGQRPHSDVCPCTSLARDESASHRSSPGRSALAIGRIRLKWARIGQSIAHLMY